MKALVNLSASSIANLEGNMVLPASANGSTTGLKNKRKKKIVSISDEVVAYYKQLLEEHNVASRQQRVNYRIL